MAYKTISVVMPDHIVSPVSIADYAFAQAFSERYGSMGDLMLTNDDANKQFQAMRTLNMYLNGVGFTPDDEDSDTHARFSDAQMYFEGAVGPEEDPSWLEYISDSRDA